MSNLLDVEFKTLVIKMLNEPRGREINSVKTFKNIENIKVEMENIKKNQSEMKTTITEMKNTLERINSRLDEAEDLSLIHI